LSKSLKSWVAKINKTIQTHETSRIRNTADPDTNFETCLHNKWIWILPSKTNKNPQFQCCGSGMFIPDPTFFHPVSRIRTVSIPDPGSLKNLSILTPKKAKKTVAKL
jgi:hypothetical protein